MRIHHFYPRTQNIGDHFVRRGIEEMIGRIVPGAAFQFFDVNRRGEEKQDFGLTRATIERANSEADLVIVGGSNLYEGSFLWPWGVHVDLAALADLRVPLFLLGLGTGSSFGSPLHKPSVRAIREIKCLNDHASLSGARDVITLEWLSQIGVDKAKLLGDPATFIFNSPWKGNREGHVLIALPPRRFWSNKRQFWKTRTRGRTLFTRLVDVAKQLAQKTAVTVVVNDPADLPLAQTLFEVPPAGRRVNAELQTNDGTPRLVRPETVGEYFELLSKSRAVIAGVCIRRLSRFHWRYLVSS